MKFPSPRQPSRALHTAVRGTLLTALVCAVAPATALDFATNDGATKINWDTTLTYGHGWRVQSKDPDLIAIAAGGKARSANSDDGDLNYDNNSYSEVIKGVTELSVNWNDSVGLFLRGSALYDNVVMDNRTERTRITDSGKDLAGSYVRMLDAFVWGRFDLGDMAAELRVGRQAINWGESTFITGGINSMNHFDVAALRAPGSEVKEAFLPQERIYASLAATENLTFEGYYEVDWNRTEPEPVGTYFSSNDYVPRGGRKVMLGFGTVSDLGTDWRPLGGSFEPDFLSVGRGVTHEPDDQGQFGVAARMFLPEFGTGTEIGLYYVNYHSKLPLLSSQTGTQAGFGNAVGARTAIAGAAQALGAGLPFNVAVGRAATAAVAAAKNAGGTYDLATATEQATIGANTYLSTGFGGVIGVAGQFVQDEFAQTASYVVEYPEDIEIIGVSFNTSVGTTGVAWQGEVSYRPDHPLQFDDVELLFAALSPLDKISYPNGVPACSANLATNTSTACGQLGGYSVGDFIPGWDTFQTYQMQTTLSRTFSNVLGASQLLVLGEAGAFFVSDLPDKNKGGPNGQGLRLNGPLTNVSGNAALAGRHPDPTEVEPEDRFATDWSYGYRMVVRLEYPGLIGPWNVLPRLVWADDVGGTSPGPGGSFVEGRHALTFGTAMNYLAKWELDLAYTTWGGAGHYNELKDRDNIVFSVKYSF